MSKLVGELAVFLRPLVTALGSAAELEAFFKACGHNVSAADLAAPLGSLQSAFTDVLDLLSRHPDDGDDTALTTSVFGFASTLASDARIQALVADTVELASAVFD